MPSHCAAITYNVRVLAQQSGSARQCDSGTAWIQHHIHQAIGRRHLYLRQLLGLLLFDPRALLGFLLLSSLALLFDLCLRSQPPLLGLFPGNFLGCFLLPLFPLLLFLLLLFLQSQSPRLSTAVVMIRCLLLSAPSGPYFPLFLFSCFYNGSAVLPLQCAVLPVCDMQRPICWRCCPFQL